MIDAERLSQVRTLAQTQPRCCPDEAREPCPTCSLLRAVDELVQEVERHRAERTPPASSVALPQAYKDLAINARALVDALEVQVHHLTEPVLIARSYVVDALEEIEQQRRG